MTSSSPVEASIKGTIDAYDSLRSELDTEVNISNTTVQIIDVNLPNITRCKDIDIWAKSTQNVTVMQFSNSDVIDSITTLLNSQVDAKINQINENGKQYIKDTLLNIKDKDDVKVEENLKISLHDSIFNGVRSFSSSTNTSYQKISFNEKGSAKYLECDSLKISADSTINTKITQLTTLILDNIKSSNSQYESQIEKLINGTDTQSISKFFPSILVKSAFKLIFIGIAIIAIVLLFGIVALVIILIITTRKKTAVLQKVLNSSNSNPTTTGGTGYSNYYNYNIPPVVAMPFPPQPAFSPVVK